MMQLKYTVDETDGQAACTVAQTDGAVNMDSSSVWRCN